jgi:thioredoxin 1
MGALSAMSTSAFKLILSAATLLVMSLGAQASQPFTAKAFADAQAAGKSILVDVYASWCPVCKVQRPIVQGLEKSNPQLAVFEVDFDKAKDVLKRFGVQYQSTLIVFKGAKEVGRSTGDTDPAAITNLIKKGL